MDDVPLKAEQPPVDSADEVSVDIHDRLEVDTQDPLPDAIFKADGIAAILQVVEEATAYLRDMERRVEELEASNHEIGLRNQLISTQISAAMGSAQDRRSAIRSRSDATIRSAR